MNILEYEYNRNILNESCILLKVEKYYFPPLEKGKKS